MRDWRKRIITAVVAVGALTGLSCQDQQTITLADMVETKITEVDTSAGTVKVNIGFLDGIHGGQSLYVTRNHKAVAHLIVRQINEYSAECFYRTLPRQLLGPMKGDPVVRRLSDIARPRTLRDRVPRMVRVPYDPDNTIVKLGEREFVIPREKYEEWKKKHEEANIRTTN